MDKEKPKTQSYWMHDTMGGVAKRTDMGWYVWSKGKGWVSNNNLVDIDQGSDLHWDELANKSDAFERIRVIEKEGYEVPFEMPETVF